MTDYNVDSFTGTDSERLAAAASAAVSGKPNRIIIPDRELQLDTPGGAGGGLNIRPGISVVAGGPNSGMFFDFDGSPATSGAAIYGIQVLGLTPTNVGTLGADAALGSDHLTMTAGHTVAVNDRLSISQIAAGSGSWTYWNGQSVDIDPPLLIDDRFRQDKPKVIAVVGNDIQLEHPLSHRLTSGATVQKIPEGGTATTSPTVIENLSLRGRPGFYYRLLHVQRCHNVQAYGLDFGICGQSFMEIRDAAGIEIDRCVGVYGGDNSWDLGSSKYKIHAVNASDLLLTANHFGMPHDDRNQSFVTFNNTLRCFVKHNTFGRTRTYCVNTHGNGARQIVIEHNQMTPGPNAQFGAILLGNESWGPDMQVYIGDNRVWGGVTNFLQMRENCSHVTVVRNVAEDVVNRFILAYGSASPSMVEPGSLEWIVKRNISNMPSEFGGQFGVYDYAGVSDVSYGANNNMPLPIALGTVSNFSDYAASETPAWYYAG